MAGINEQTLLERLSKLETILWVSEDFLCRRAGEIVEDKEELTGEEYDFLVAHHNWHSYCRDNRSILTSTGMLEKFMKMERQAKND